MLPLLKFAGDEKEHSMAEAIENLAGYFKLSGHELNEWLPSKKQKIFQNRVNWAKAYLKMAGLVENTKRSHFKITQRGLETLKENPDIINHKYLRKFPDFNDLRESWKKTSVSKDANHEQTSEITDSNTPEEILDTAYQKIRTSLELEVLSKLKSIHPSFFERIVVELLVKMGYGGSIQDAGKAIGKTGDEGIDGIIKEDKLGLDVIYVQAKRWDGNVGRPELHKFVGALAGQGAKKGIFITTSFFTKDARDYVPKNETKIVLIDGDELASLMIDYNLGVSVQSTYEIKKIDQDYFEEE
ncbi:MAG: restriction endonuclease [Chitinophagaceae bacterium]|nr:restriction endonuclease [Chitinophagaceae bacterium]